MAKPGSGLTDRVEQWIFPTECINPRLCNKPTSYLDANSNLTTYVYDQTHGGLVTETYSPVSVSGGSGSVSLVKRYFYAQRYAWISNGTGGYVQGGAPIWLLMAEKMCRTTATVSGACAGGAADEITISYDYGPDSGPNNLLLRGKIVTADGQNLRTCYGYDDRGNIISETSPRAGLAVCS